MTINYMTLAVVATLATTSVTAAETTATAVSGKTAKPSTGKKSSLGNLVKSLDKAVSYSAKAAKKMEADTKKAAAPAVASETKEAEKKTASAEGDKKTAHHGDAVLLSLKQLNTSVEKLQKAAEARDKEMFAAIDATGKELAELKVAIRYTGVDDEKIKEGVAVLDDAFDLIQENYSKPAARKAKGGELSAEEKTKYSELKDHQKKLEKSLTELQTHAKDNERLVKELKKMTERLQKNTKKKDTVDNYVSLLLLLEEIDQEYNALTWYVEKTKPTWAAEWTKTATVFAAFSTWNENVQNSIELTDMNYLSEEAELEEEDDIEVSMSDEEESAADEALEEEDVTEDDAGDDMEEEEEDEDDDSGDDDEDEDEDDDEGDEDEGDSE